MPFEWVTRGKRRWGTRLLAACGALTATAAASDGPVVLDELPLLFANDHAIAVMEGMARTVHPARTRSEPVLIADRRWEGRRVYTYGSVIRDPVTGQFRLWYMTRSEDSDATATPVPWATGHHFVAYATSADGWLWTKPVLGLHEFQGSKENNIVAHLQSPAVVSDSFEPDPAKRYKLLGYARGGCYAMYSADGIRWASYRNEPVFAGDDTMTLTQNPRTGEFMAYFKKVAEEAPGRVVWLARSGNFVDWSKPVLVFRSDAEDNRWARPPDQRTDVYDMTVVPHADGFIGLPAIFRIVSRQPEGTPRVAGRSGQDGPIDIQLATSVDGIEWTRSYPRVHVIPRGPPGAFDGGLILGVTSTAIHSGDTSWVLYTGLNTGHGGAIPPKRGSIGRADWRLHGFVSLDASAAGGRLTIRPLIIRGGALVVNADASRGELRVALLEPDRRPLPGFGLEDCEPLKSDATRHRMRWKPGHAVPEGRPLLVLIEMTSARLYSIAGAAAAR